MCSFITTAKTEPITTDKVIIVNPGEVHSADGFGSTNLSFRMVYVPESSFREVVSQRMKLPGSLCFSQTVLSDPSVSRDLSKALHALDSDTSLLAKQGMLLDIMAAVILRFGSWSGVIDRSVARTPLTTHVSIFTTAFLTTLAKMTLERKRV